MTFYKIYNRFFYVNRIKNINYKKRLFMIFDRDKPYILEFTYISSKGKYNYSFRYETKEDCQNQINKIEELKKFYQITTKF